jgi:phosphoribosyl 1,2-cyclic phosphodiesterase
VRTSLTFWGVRGSVPAFDLRTWRYGGNTACVEVRTPAEARIIIDGGTGLRGLGHSIRGERSAGSVQGTFLLSHYHWDHIQGLPFFPMLYDSRNSLMFCGLRPESSSGMEGVLQGQMSRPYFPVNLTVLAAARSFSDVVDGSRLQIGDAVIEARNLNHPQGCLGFRIETQAGTVVYASDTEPGDVAGDRNVRELARDADVLIYDAQFAPDEIEHRRGWGHSTWEEGVRVARDAGARDLVLFHHDPEADDSIIDERQRCARKIWPQTWAAAEGMVLTCHEKRVECTSVAPRIGPRPPAKLMGRLVGRRVDGSPFRTPVRIQNLTIKGAYVTAADVESFHSDVELELSDWAAKPVVLGGKVVRFEKAKRGSQVGMGIVFSSQGRVTDRQSREPRSKPGNSKGGSQSRRAGARPT